MIGGIGGEKCRTAAAHAFHNAITQIVTNHKPLHGEIVGVGILLQLKLEETELSCNTGSGDGFSDLLTHQKIVRDYINLYTPYRGILLYHGLGSGKTCSSIAIAEGLKDSRKIWVMNKASLQMNYFKELKKCGDPMYRKTQYWEFVSIIDQPDKLDILSKALYLPKDVITENKGAWMVDITKQPNYDMLTTDEKKSLDDQLTYMIRMKYNFINYNGLTMENYNTLTKNYTLNPFNDSVVVIDEAHNLVSRIVNQLKNKKNAGSLSMLLYRDLMSAENCKIVMLTGTPMINYPNELGVLYNILRGYIKTWHIRLEPEIKIDSKYLEKLFSKDNVLAHSLDFVSYNNKELIVIGDIGKAPTLIFWFHGYGSNNWSFEPTMKMINMYLDDNFCIIMPNAPIVEGKRSWYPLPTTDSSGHIVEDYEGLESCLLYTSDAADE